MDFVDLCVLGSNTLQREIDLCSFDRMKSACHQKFRGLTWERERHAKAVRSTATTLRLYALRDAGAERYIWDTWCHIPRKAYTIMRIVYASGPANLAIHELNCFISMKIDVLLRLEPLLAGFRRVGSNVDYLSETKSKKKPCPKSRHMSEAQGRASKYEDGWAREIDMAGT